MKYIILQQLTFVRLRKYSLELFKLFCFGLALLVSTVVFGQTVRTDKLDYLPGETAYARGLGWLPNEPITLNVHEEPIYHPDVVTNTTADANGVFENVAIYNFEEHDYGSSFTLTATGQLSGQQVIATFTDGKGAYSLNFAAADPSIYIPPIPYPGPDPNVSLAPSGRGDGDALIPLAEFNDGTVDVRVESLAPEDMALGQIVPFETKITVNGDVTPENGEITIVIGWNTLTTNAGDFGYDGRPGTNDVGYGVYGAFIDTGDGAHVDPGTDAMVSSFNWQFINDEIVGVFTVVGLDDGDVVVLEAWLVLDNTIPEGIGGNVQSRLIVAGTGGDQTIDVAPSGAITLRNALEDISTGNQTVPLLKPSDFFTADVDVSVVKSDEPDPVELGETLTYTIEATNTGPSVANQVVIYDELDPNVTFVSASDGGFINTDPLDAIPDGAVQWNVGALTAGQTVMYTITVTVNSDAPTDGTATEVCGSGDLENNVTITTISDDTDPSNNTDCEPTDVLCNTEAPIITSTNISCFGDGNGTVTVTNYNTDYTYVLWKGVESTTETIDEFGVYSNLGPGSYYVVVSQSGTPDDPCAAQSNTVIITDPPAVTLALTSSTDPTCFGGSDGSIVVSASGGTGGSYEYSIDGTTWVASGTFSNLGADDYILYARNFNTSDAGCNASIPVTLTDPPAVTLALTSSTDPTCFGGSDGSIVVSASGGTGGSYEYSIDGTTWVASGTFSNLGADDYILYARNFNTSDAGCNASIPVTLTDPPAVTLALTSSTDPTCFGGSDGSIVVSASGGTGGSYEYSIDGTTWVASGTFSNLGADDYILYARNFNTSDAGCNASIPVTLTDPPAVTLALTSSTDPTCFGGSDGSIVVSASGGTGGSYEYSIDGTTWVASGTFSNLGADDYILYARNFNTSDAGCNASIPVTLTDPPAVTLALTSSTDPTCFGGSDGSIVVSASGGTGGSYEYSIDGTTWVASGTFSNLGADDYILYARNFNTSDAGCNASIPVTLTDPPAVTLALTSSTDPTCFGGSDGSIVVSASGGTGGSYEYSIDGTTWVASGTFSNLGADDYILYARNFNTSDAGCNASIPVTLTDPPAVTLALTSSTDPTCFGGSDGSIVVSASGGTGGSYEYSIDGTTWVASGTFSNLGADDYILYARNFNTSDAGCNASIPVTLTDPPAVTLALTSSTDPTCFGGSDGSIVVSASGGTGGSYEYSIDGTTWVASGTFSNLGADDYILYARNFNTSDAGCNASIPVTLTDPPAVTLALTSSTDPTCFGGSDGSIVVSASGGTGGSYEYSIDGTTWVASGTFSNLGADDYILYARNFNTSDAGCNASIPVTLTDPPAVTLALTSSTDPTCFGGSDGSIVVSASGGTGGSYEYSIDGTTWVASGTFSNLGADDYILYARNFNTSDAGCNASIPVTLTDPPAVTLALTSSTDPTCFGGSDGSIVVSASGGTGGSYEYSIDGTTWVASGTFSNLGADDYILYARNFNTSDAGCNASIPVTLTDPPAVTLALTSSTDPTCFGGSDGSIVVSASGGTGGSYEYSIDGTTWVASGTFSNLGADDYILYARNFNTSDAGCNASIPVTLTDPPAVTLALTSSTDPTCFGGSDGSIVVSASGGTGGSYEYSIDGTTWVASGTFSNLGADDYILYARNFNTSDAGCNASIPVTLTDPPAVTLALTSSTDPTCFGGSDGSIVVSASGGTGGSYEYSIDGTTWVASGTFSNLGADDYILYARNFNTSDAGCNASIPVTLTDPPAVTLALTSSTDPTCFGGSDGSIVVSASGGTGGSYEYSIDGTTWVASGTFSNLGADDYILYARNFNTSDAGCNASIPVTLTDPPAVTLALTSSTDPTCFGGSDGSIVVSASGGTGGSYEYSIDGTTWVASGTFSNLGADDYILYARNFNTSDAGCNAQVVVVLDEPDEIILSIEASVDCTLGPDGLPSGTITVTGSGYETLQLWNTGADGQIGGANADFQVIDKVDPNNSDQFINLDAGSYYVIALAQNSAGTADACSAMSEVDFVEKCYWFDIFKVTQGIIDPTRDWNFTIYNGPDGFGSGSIATDGTLGDEDGVLDFVDESGFLNLDPTKTYTICEENMAAGWSAIWMTDVNGTQTVLMTRNPNADDNPSQDLGNRCFDIGAGTSYPLVPDGTFRINVDNTYPGGTARTPGYWKNWNTCTGGGQAANAARNGGWQEGFWLLDDVLNDPGVTLGELVVETCKDGRNILDQRDINNPKKKKASDAAYNLAMHLMAFKLNQAAGAYHCQYAIDAAMAADELLSSISYNGTGSYLKGKDPRKSNALELAGILDRYNNNDLDENECSGGSLRIADGSPTIEEELVGELELKAYPIPYENEVSFDFTAPVDTRATLEIISMTGAILEKAFDRDLKANVKEHIEVNLSKYGNAMLLYRFSTNQGQKLGKLIPKR